MLLKDYDISFNRGSVLTKEMLCEMYDYARDYVKIRYDCYGDGILEGMEVKRREDGSVCIGKGLVKYESRIYRMVQELDLSLCIDGWKKGGIIKSNTYYKLNFVPYQSSADKDFGETGSSIAGYALKAEVGRKSDEMPGIHFSTFILNGEGELEVYNKNDLKNIAKARFWNMVDCPYAARNSSTYHPYIFQVIKGLIEKRPEKTYFDYVLLNQICSRGTADMELILIFLRDHGRNIEAAGRACILAEFLEVLEGQNRYGEGDIEKQDAISEMSGGMLL